MKKHLIILFCLLSAMANAKVVQLDSTKHEVRLGWGDFMFESLVHHSSRTTPHYRYTGHIFAEYQYQINDWFSIGGQVDYEQVWWDVAYRNGKPLPQIEKNHNYWNVCLMPAFRFTYYYHPWVTLYSAIYVGLNINGGSDTNYKGQYTACAFDFGATLLGVKVGQKKWFGCVEIGGLSALNNMHEIYMLDSRIFTVSIGRRF